MTRDQLDAPRAKAAAEIAHRVRKYISYDQVTGEFRWLSGTSKRGRRPGAIAGAVDSQGYRRINIDRQKYAAHRLAWLLVTGDWPNGEIDHVNGIRSDNRIQNLREASRITNLQNLKRANSRSSTGLLGVVRKEGGHRFGARIRVNTKQKWLGSFATPDEAHAAYILAKRALHPGNTL